MHTQLLDPTAAVYAALIASIVAPFYVFIIEPELKIDGNGFGCAALRAFSSIPDRIRTCWRYLFKQINTKCRRALLLNRNRCDSIASVALTPTRESVAAAEDFFTPASARRSTGSRARRSARRSGEEAASPSPTLPMEKTPQVHSTSEEGSGPRKGGSKTASPSRFSLPRWRGRAGAAGEDATPSAITGEGEKGAEGAPDEAYARTAITARELDALFARPAFHDWYAAHRPGLLAEVRRRGQAALWTSLCAFVVLLLGLCALPAFGFSNESHAIDGETFLELARRRLQRPLRPRAMGFAGGRGAREGELVLLLAAGLGLLTSAFIPRGSRSKGALALGCFLVLLLECALVPGVRIQAGMGLAVVSGFIAVSIAQGVHD